MSGADLPLKSQQEIFDFYDANAGKEFVHFGTEEFQRTDVIRRVKYYWNLQDLVGNSKKIHLNFLNQVQKAYVALQMITGVNRVKNEGAFYGGEAWWDITEPFARYVISKKDWIERVFHKSKCCDEVFMQTLLKNSLFWENCFRKSFDSAYDEKRYSIMRAIDWNRGNPYTWKKEDYDMLVNSDFLYARKFDIHADREIIDLICDHVK